MPVFHTTRQIFITQESNLVLECCVFFCFDCLHWTSCNHCGFTLAQHHLLTRWIMFSKGFSYTNKRLSCLNGALNTNSTRTENCESGKVIAVNFTILSEISKVQCNFAPCYSRKWIVAISSHLCVKFETAGLLHGCETQNQINLIVTVQGNGFNCLPSWRKWANWMQQRCLNENVEEHSHVMMCSLFTVHKKHLGFRYETKSVQNQNTKGTQLTVKSCFLPHHSSI